jgi:polysaccharide biosynthesis/export protein
MITVSAPDPEAALPFNLPAAAIASVASTTANSQLQYQLYLIDKDGTIEFPVLGSVKIGGLQREEALQLLKDKLKDYMTNPIVNIRIMNYKVSVTGEVARPGSFNLVSERVTLPEALSMAGDLTIYGRRDNITVIRDVDGTKTINHVDITKSDFVNSDFYYLSQNDVVYVEPNKTRINSSVIGPNVTASLTALSLVITVVALLIR